MGSILRTQADTDWTHRKVAGFALFVGAALSVKLTLSILPAIALLLTIIMSRRMYAGFASACLAVVIGIVIWFGMILIDANGHPSFVVQHFRDLLAFMQSSLGVTQSGLHWSDWLFSRISHSSLTLSLIYSGPIIAGLSLLVARRRWEFAASVSFFLEPRLMDSSFLKETTPLRCWSVCFLSPHCSLLLVNLVRFLSSPLSSGRAFPFYFG
jgi:hypothetical protein